MRSKLLTKLISEIPLSTSLKVINQMAFIDFLTEMGFREDKMWTDKEDDFLEQLSTFSTKHTEHIIRVLNEHNINAENTFVK